VAATFISPTTITVDLFGLVLQLGQIAVQVRNDPGTDAPVVTTQARTFTVRSRADINCDGDVGSDDVLLALLLIARMTVEVPGCSSDADGLGGPSADLHDAWALRRMAAGLDPIP
jgi:hypothetical protein